jgi:hypothetical protein
LIDFRANGLDKEVSDDRLVATVLEYASRDSSRPILIATGDFGLEVKVKARREIQPLPMPETLKLPSDEDPEKRELRGLRGSLAKYQNATPKLRLVGYEGGDRVLLGFRAARDSRDRLDRIMKRLCAKYTFMSKSPANGNTISGGYIVPNFLITQPKEIDEFNSELQEFFEDYRSWYLNFEKNLNFKRLSCPLVLAVVNDGNNFAEDIHVKIHLPDGFEVFENYPELADGPHPPVDPLQQRFASPLSYSRPFDYSAMPSVTRPRGPVNLRSLRRGNSYDAVWEITRLRQRDSLQLTPTLLIHFADISRVRNFEIEYQITAANSPIFFDGKMVAMTAVI